MFLLFDFLPQSSWLGIAMAQLHCCARFDQWIGNGDDRKIKVELIGVMKIISQTFTRSKCLCILRHNGAIYIVFGMVWLVYMVLLTSN